MARAIYEIKLQERYFPALSEEDALEMQRNGSCRPYEGPWNVKCIVKEEHTMKLFLLAKAMYDTEKFGYNEISAALRALAVELGYYSTCDDVADCVTTWVERISEDMTMSELEEWIIG